MAGNINMFIISSASSCESVSPKKRENNQRQKKINMITISDSLLSAIMDLGKDQVALPSSSSSSSSSLVLESIGL
jgi:hypothetical protein